jgi:hypothetical protein
MPAEVRNAGVEAQRVTRALCTWETEVEQWSPDVVILNYAQYECMPGLLPHWFERHAVGWHHHSSPLRDRYRIQVLGPVWRTLVRRQRSLDSVIKSGPFRASPHKTVMELQRLVDQIRTVSSPLIIVMDTWPIATRWQKWFPGMQERTVNMRREIVKWLEELDNPEIRLFSLSEIVSRQDLDEALPDGVHFSHETHREIAEELALVILPWAATQPHLRRPSLKIDPQIVG